MEIKKYKGFTLVELLIVIAIIGILAAVILVSLGSQRERARRTAFKQQMASLVAPATICRDMQGTITTPMGSGQNICDTSHPVSGATIPTINNCLGSGSVVPTVTNGNSDDFVISANCGGGCSAICKSSGCEFSGCD